MQTETPSRRGVYAVLIAGALGSLFVAGTYVAPLLPGGLGRLLSWMYSPLCHQLADRSVAVGTGFQAVCARCSGLYLGAAAGLLVATFCVRTLSRKLRPLVFGIGVAPTLVDALLPWVGLPNLPNLPRLLVALPAGFVAGLFLAIGIADLFTQRRDTLKSETTNYAPAAEGGNSLEVCDG